MKIGDKDNMINVNMDKAKNVWRDKIREDRKPYFESLDVDFDPNLHEALLEQNSDSFNKGKIMNEYEKGYKYHDKIIRHAKVVVSKGKEKK